MWNGTSQIVNKYQNKKAKINKHSAKFVRDTYNNVIDARR